MHRHGYSGKKFGRESAQRRALLKALAEALIVQESIETTLPKAKAVASYTEKLITKAKKGDLTSRRQVIASLQTISSAHKLVDELAPKLNNRVSGYLRVKRTSLRRGDNAQMARVSFVDDLTVGAKKTAKVDSAPEKPAPKPKSSVKAKEVAVKS
jgi:large subunit ribosomal protein L17